MRLFLKMLCLNEHIIMVLLVTTLIAHNNVSGVSAIKYGSQPNFIYENSVDSNLISKSSPYDSAIYNVVNSTTEMDPDDSTVSADTEQRPNSMDSAVMTMQRLGTLDGLSPIYSLTIHGNGSVIYEGIKNVDTKGIQTYQIPKDKARELVTEFINIYYTALKDSYGDPAKASSLPLVKTSFNLNGKTKTILDNHSSFAPPTLRALEDKIDEVAISKQWIKRH
jgi:hypothetical protein